MKKTLTPLLWAFACASSWSTNSDVADITHLMKRQFDRPDAPLLVAPVSVDSGFALAGWRQGATGGRALLRKGHAGWTIDVCAGKGLNDAKVLIQAGLPNTIAQRLAKQSQADEQQLSASERQQLDLFKGTQKVHGHSDHHTAHPH